jgi:hypothetical protein
MLIRTSSGDGFFSQTAITAYKASTSCSSRLRNKFSFRAFSTEWSGLPRGETDYRGRGESSGYIAEDIEQAPETILNNRQTYGRAGPLQDQVEIRHWTKELGVNRDSFPRRGRRYAGKPGLSGSMTRSDIMLRIWASRALDTVCEYCETPLIATTARRCRL